MSHEFYLCRSINYRYIQWLQDAIPKISSPPFRSDELSESSFLDFKINPRKIKNCCGSHSMFGLFFCSCLVYDTVGVFVILIRPQMQNPNWWLKSARPHTFKTPMGAILPVEGPRSLIGVEQWYNHPPNHHFYRLYETCPNGGLCLFYPH